MKQLNSFYLNNRRRVLSRIANKTIDVSDISIISMNCIGGIIYHDCNARFLSPTIDLFFTAADFIKFINNLEYYLSITPIVILGTKYPIGLLGDIKLYFMHYDSPETAFKKWEERKKRINKDRIFVIMIERNGFNDEVFEDFKRIPYPKFLFAKSSKYECKDSLVMPKYKDEPNLPDIIPGRYMYKKMKIIKAIKKAYN